MICPCFTQITNVTRSLGVGGVILHGNCAWVPATASTFVVITKNVKR